MRITESKTTIIDGEIEWLLTYDTGDKQAIRMSQQEAEVAIGQLDMAVIELVTLIGEIGIGSIDRTA